MSEDSATASYVQACRRQIQGFVRDDLYTRVLYSTDASLYQVMPHAVLIPRSTDDVVAAMSLAADYKLPVLARAAGTSLAGQAVNEAVVIDFSRHLDAILEINAEEGWARVQPGVVVDDLNAVLRPHGLQFGPDPASSNRSTVGGAVANNATGSHSLIYGMTVEHVRAMEAVLADGRQATFGTVNGGAGGKAKFRIENKIDTILADPTNQQAILTGTSPYWRRCGGYNLDRLLDPEQRNLAQLVCGSEGTLAVMTEITLKLVPCPAATGLLLLEFNELYAALSAVPLILETGPTAVELLDNLSLSLCRDVPEYARLLASVVQGQPICMLVVEFQGDSEAAVLSGIEALEQRLRRSPSGVTGMTRALSAAAQSAVWRVRKVGLGLLMSMKGDLKPVPFIEDAAVPVEYLPDYVRHIEEYCAGLGTPITYYAHAGTGCLHIRPLINRRSAQEVAKMPDIARFAASLVRGYGGALSSEHGDGRSRSWLNETFYGPALYKLFGEVKRLFDPDNRLNPGIIVDPAPMTALLRALPASAGRSHTSFADHEPVDQEPVGQELRVAISSPSKTLPTDGFSRAVGMCNGAGVCRQRIGGTMCPSFMVTRDEEHSTRGRANALQAALAGVLPLEELTSRRMFEVMDLCIACKGCKAECPSAVDMARIKTEFLARYYKVHGTPLRARFFGHSASLNRLASGPMSIFSRPLLHSAVGQRLLTRVLNLSPQRSLPLPVREPFSVWWRHAGSKLEPGKVVDEIVLLVDPFTNFNHPEVGIAAVEFLVAAGVTITAAPVVDEGRPFISKGMVAQARRAAGRALATLAPAAEAGQTIVGLEPSSLLTLRDEYYNLLPDDERVAAVAGRALTFEEYIDRLAGAVDLRPLFRAEPRRILLHGHCHQKALVGTGPARRVLALPPGTIIEEVDSGCCGMAGSFGYEAEHYEIAMQMAERRLLPAVRASSKETIIAAAGVSCREQIAHGSGRNAFHPAQILRDALSGRAE